MRLDDLFVDKPIKEQPVVEDMLIDGSFECQSCGHESEEANLRDGKLWWICKACNFRSVAGGFG